MITLKTKPSAILVGLALTLVACGDEGVVETATIPDLEPAAAIPETVDTETLVVEESFSFDTARMIEINFDITDARTEEASVSICTEYKPVGEFYDINYGSCPVKGRLEDGVFNHSMSVTNAYDSVVAIIWFQNPEFAPIFEEFEVESRTRAKQDRQAIVWQR